MTDAVQIELIRAAAFIIPSALGAYTAWKSARNGKALKEVKGALDGVLADRVQAAGDLGHAEGKAAGVTEERDRL